MTHRSVALLTALLFSTFTTVADEPHHHDHGPLDLGSVGSVTFRTSCRAAVQKDFNRAVALMHSFWYAEAEREFGRVAQADPKCAMAHWGVAMSNYHPLWAPPTPDELRRGGEAAAKAREIGGKTPRERALIDAVNVFYADAERVDHATRAAAFEKAMANAEAGSPNDDETAVFHALALLGTASPADKTYAVQKRAAETLNRILAKQPEHPGIAHYIIHSYDYPALATLALPAARAYAKLAPGSPHALHMPSHIFTRLGLWDESIASNTASADKARAYVQQLKPGAVSFDELHAIDYLVYANLQEGNDEPAKALRERLVALDGDTVYLGNFAAAYAMGAVPARYALERRQWAEAATLPMPHGGSLFKSTAYAEGNVHFARAIGAARSGDLNAAKAAVDRLAEIRQQLVDQKNSYWAGQLEIQRLAGQAWLAYAAGLKDEGLRLMRSAAELEDQTEKHPVTPGPVVPARELYADMLLEHGQGADALAEAEKVLAVAPNRYNAILLAARSADSAGDAQKAQSHYRALLQLAGKSSRRDLEQARTYIAAK